MIEMDSEPSPKKNKQTSRKTKLLNIKLIKNKLNK